MLCPMKANRLFQLEQQALMLLQNGVGRLKGETCLMLDIGMCHSASPGITSLYDLASDTKQSATNACCTVPVQCLVMKCCLVWTMGNCMLVDSTAKGAQLCHGDGKQLISLQTLAICLNKSRMINCSAWLQCGIHY